MLKREVMSADEWHDNVPQDLITVSLCIQISIDKIKLCWLSEAHACPYHNSTTTMLIHTTLYMLSSICPVQMKPGIRLLRAHYSSVPVAIEGERLPTEVGYDAKLQSGQDPGEDDDHADNCLRETYDSLCRNSLFVQTDNMICCPGGWSQMIPQVKKPDGGPGLEWLHVVLDALPNSQRIMLDK